MGIFGKLKNIFYDEEFVDEPEEEKVVKKTIKKEEPKIEKIDIHEEEEKRELPKKEETNTFSERELFRSERTFNFTELDEEEELPKRKSVLDEDNIKTRLNNLEEKKAEAPKQFKLSPVISPIYGILDKDYKREEVVSKPSYEKTVTTTATTYDTVRRKAYGTLEDELEDTLNSINSITVEEIKDNVDTIEKEMDKLNKKSNKIENIIQEIEKTTSDISIGEIEDTVKEKYYDDMEDEEENIDKTMTDCTLEHDLFNLIDSMYDDKED